MGEAGHISQAELGAWIHERIERKAPTAIARFGDAEARLLCGELADRDSMAAVLDHLRRESGLSLSAGAAMEIKALLETAFDRADALGIEPRERAKGDHAYWMAKLADLHAEQIAAGRSPALLAHCMLGHQILDELPELLAGRRVGIVSCRDLEPIVAGEWGAQAVTYQLPSQYEARDIDGAFEAGMHEVPIWPDGISRVESELTVRARGEVFLIGAGVFGKHLGIRIRDEGGIALDMGSALDKMAGKITRGPRRRILDFYAGGMPAEKIVVQLQRLYGAEPSKEEVMEAILEGVRVDLAAWQNRPLRPTYESIQFEAVKFELNAAGGMTTGRKCDVAVGDTPDGAREALAISVSATTDEAPDPAMLADLQRRGVRQPSLEHAGEPFEALDEARRSISMHGPFPDEDAATALVYLALRRNECNSPDAIAGKRC